MAALGDVDAMILCGGLGTRLRSAIGGRQKVAAEVGGKPFLILQLERLQRAGVKRVILAAGFGADDVEQAALDADLGLETVMVRESEPLGTGGAIKYAGDAVQSKECLILNGDCFCPVDLSAFVSAHRRRKALVSLVASRMPDPRDYGTVLFDDDDRVRGFLEKDPDRTEAGWVNAGIYCFSRKAFMMMPEKDRFSVEHDFFPEILERRVFGYRVENEIFDIGTPERFARAQEIFKKGIT